MAGCRNKHASAPVQLRMTPKLYPGPGRLPGRMLWRVGAEGEGIGCCLGGAEGWLGKEGGKVGVTCPRWSAVWWLAVVVLALMCSRYANGPEG